MTPSPYRALIRKALLFSLIGGLVTVGGLLPSHPAGALTATCNYYWTGASSSEWGTKANWSTTNGGGASSSLPSSTSNVCMSTSPTRSTIDVDNTENVGSIQFPVAGSVTPDIDISSTLNVESTTVASSIADVTDTEYLEIWGSVTVANLSVNDGGETDGMTSDAVLTLTGSSSITGGQTWYVGNDGTLSVINSGTLTIDADSQYYAYNESTFANSGKVFMDNESAFNDDGSGVLVTNDEGATLTFNGGVDGAIIYSPFDNEGTVTAVSGILQLSNSSDEIGPDAQCTGSGTVGLTGAATPSSAASASDPANLAGLTLQGGTLTSGDFVVPSGKTFTVGDSSGQTGGLDAANVEVQHGATFAVPLNYTLYFDDSSTITNDGLISLTTNNSFSSANELYDDDDSNNNVINESDGEILDTGTATDQIAIISTLLTNAGTLEVSGAGTIRLSNAVTLEPTSVAITPTSDVGGVTMPNGEGVVGIWDTAQPDSGVNGSLDGLTLLGGDLTGATGAGHFVVDSGQFFFIGCPTGGCNGEDESAADVQNSGTIVVDSNNTWYFTGSSTLENSGLITMTNGSSFYDEDGSVTNLFTNESSGTVNFTGTNDTETADIEMAFVNHGTLDVPDGVLDVYLTIATLTTNGNLSQGTWDATGIINITGLYNATTLPYVLTNYATITLSAADGIFGNLEVGGTSVLNSLRTNDGSITTAVSTSAGNGITNDGTIDVQHGGTLKAPSYTQAGKSSSETTVDGTLQAGSSGTGAIDVTGGELTGDGTVKGDVTDGSGGTVLLPAATGGAALKVTGTYTAESGSTTDEQIDGTTGAGVEFGQLAVTGAATLGGTFKVSPLDGYTPTTAINVAAVTDGSTSGFFTATSAPSLSGGLAYGESYASKAVDLVTSTSLPTVTSVSPDKIGAGASGKSVTITGTGFSSGATLKSSDAGVTFSSVKVVSATKITAKVSATSKATLGATGVLVANSSGASGACACLTVDAAPSIKKVSPSSGAQGKTVTVTITGKYFASGITAALSGTGVTIKVTKVTSTKLTLSFTISKSAAKGSRSLTLTNSDGGTVTKSSAFKIT